MIGLLLILFVLLFPCIIGAMIFYTPQNTSQESSVLDGQSISQLEDPGKVLDVAEKHEERDDYRQAIKAWSRYQQLQSNDPAGYFRRAIDWQRLDDHERALEDLRKAKSATEDPPAMFAYHRAKSYAALGREDDALSAYEAYLEQKPEELSAWKPVANWAFEHGYYQRARTLWEHIRETADSPLQEHASLNLAKIDIERDQPERAMEGLNSLNEAELQEAEQNYFQYLRGRLREHQGELSEAYNVYQDLYERDPEYRDLEKRLPEDQRDEDQNPLLTKYFNLPREEFREFCRSMIEDMGYEVTGVEVLNEEEVLVESRDTGGMNIMNVDRHQFSFKRWDNPAGQMAIKDFEMSLLEERFDHGYFVNPGGFKDSAHQLAEGNPDLTLTRPQELVTQVKDSQSTEEFRTTAVQ